MQSFQTRKNGKLQNMVKSCSENLKKKIFTNSETKIFSNVVLTHILIKIQIHFKIWKKIVIFTNQQRKHKYANISSKYIL